MDTDCLHIPSGKCARGQSIPSGDTQGMSNEKVAPPPRSNSARHPRRCIAACVSVCDMRVTPEAIELQSRRRAHHTMSPVQDVGLVNGRVGKEGGAPGSWRP